MFQHTAARRRLAFQRYNHDRYPSSFNTQPPEGGWMSPIGFQARVPVSTHSRPKAAGRFCGK
ncbi:hypothetical protein [Neisseria sicca]|uniref:hypothetical protein n=1 Tax=Neisseria sicca TaxID=490 RepID=UPI0039658C60